MMHMRMCCLQERSLQPEGPSQALPPRLPHLVVRRDCAREHPKPGVHPISSPGGVRPGFPRSSPPLHASMSTGEDGAPPWAQSSSMGPMMRKRHEKSGRAAVGNGSTNAVTSVSGVLSRFDVYARIDDDLAVKTQAGAAVTIGFWVFMVVLCIGEIQAYRKLRPPTERVVVDSSLGQRLRININIVRANCWVPLSRQPTRWICQSYTRQTSP